MSRSFSSIVIVDQSSVFIIRFPLKNIYGNYTSYLPEHPEFINLINFNVSKFLKKNKFETKRQYIEVINFIYNLDKLYNQIKYIQILHNTEIKSEVVLLLNIMIISNIKIILFLLQLYIIIILIIYLYLNISII